MDRICPFLALDVDSRTAVDGYDPDHRCGAISPPEFVERGTQVQLCLQAGHRQCERFIGRTGKLAPLPAIARPAPDATYASTRLVLQSDGASWRTLPRTASSPQPARVMVAGAAAIAVLGGVAAATTAGFGLFTPPAQGPAASNLASVPTPSPKSTPVTTSPRPTPTSSPRESSDPTPTSSASAASAEPTATPAQRVYVVHKGDTLNGIAVRFGVTIAALRSANALTGDVINIGQSLVIP